MRNLIALLALLLITACSTTTTTPPVVVTPTPETGLKWWTPGPVAQFQIMHAEKGLSEVKKKLRAGTQVVTMEMDQLTPEIVAHLHAKNIKVIAYTSSGYEDWRDDATHFPKEAVGGKICKSSSCLTWWKGEKWGKPLSKSFFDFHATRVARALLLKVDGIEFDNMDWAWNKVGYSITREQNLKAVLELTTLAHNSGLAMFAKNTPELAKDLAPHVEGVFVEECNDNEECDQYLPYQGKLVAMLEYSTSCSPFKGAACNKQNDYFE